jgi:hypothetical protein
VCTDPDDPDCPAPTAPDPCFDLSLDLFDGGVNCGGAPVDDGGGGDASSGDRSAPAPIPCDFSAQTLLSYMQSTPAYIDGQPSSKTFATLANATTIMTDAVADNVDPRLLVAISFLESKWGGSSGSQRTDNAFGLMGSNGLINFTSSGG